MGCSSSAPIETSIHQFTVKDCNGRDVNLGQYKGKVLLVVNVASKCGFTDTNYSQLSELYTKYKNKDFEILAFPCNQFLRQEPGTSLEAKDFACTRYQAEYPIFQKVRVNGPETAPVYKFLKASQPGFLGSRIKWNFTKFLVDRDGKAIARYSPTKEPLSFEACYATFHGIFWLNLCKIFCRKHSEKYNQAEHHLLRNSLPCSLFVPSFVRVIIFPFWVSVHPLFESYSM